MTNKTYIECQCTNMSHVIRLSYTKYDEDDKELNVEYYLDHYLPWYKRIWVSILYTFKCIPYNSHFNATIISDDCLDDIERIIKEYKKL